MKSLYEGFTQENYENVLKLFSNEGESFIDDAATEIFDEYGNYMFPTEALLCKPNQLNSSVDCLIESLTKLK